jgi:hypothetical protein
MFNKVRKTSVFIPGGFFQDLLILKRNNATPLFSPQKILDSP